MKHFADAATAAGTVVLWGACLELGSHGLPHTALPSILRQLWHRWPIERLVALLPSSEMLREIVPEFAVGRPAVADQARLYSIFGELLERLSDEAPLLLVAEDIHWADQSTRDLLSMLAHELRNARVQIIMTYRSDEHTAEHPAQLFLAKLARVARVTRLDLGRLNENESQALIAELLGDAEPSSAVVGRLFELSGGNAFFLEELTYRYSQLDDQAEFGGLARRSLHDMLVGPVRRLPARAQQVVHSLAVGGRSVSHQLLAAVAGLPADILSTALKDAVDGHVLVAQATRYEFRHTLVREAILEGLVPADTIPLHRRYAEVLRRWPQLIGLDRAEAAIAHHWCHADDIEQALPALLRAARLAQTARAPAERLGFLQRALDMGPRFSGFSESMRLDMLEAAAAAARDCAHFDLAAGMIDRAVGLVDQEREPVRAARLLAFRSALLLHLSWGLETQESLAAAKRAQRLVRADGSGGRGGVLLVLAEALLYAGDAVQALETSEEVIRIAHRPSQYRLSCAARTVHALANARLGFPKRAIAELNETRMTADEHRDLAGTLRVDIHLCMLLRSTGESSHDAIVAARRGQETAASAGLARTRGMWVATYLAGTLFDSGQWDEAETTIRQAVELGPDALHAAAPHLAAALIAIGRGDSEAARERLLNVHAGLKYARHAHPLVAHVNAILALREQRIDDARIEVRQAMEKAESYIDIRAVWTLLVTAAQVEIHAHMVSQLPAAYLATESNTEIIRKIAAALPTNAPAWLAFSAHVAAELDSYPTPSSNWIEVAHAWDMAGNTYYACYARLRAAEAAAARQDRAVAQQLMRSAAAQAIQLGATWLYDDINQLASRARLPAPPGGTSGPAPHEAFDLTQREMEVLKLLTDGLSNREIADRLLVANKTVSAHVSRILAKLGVSTRGQAVAAVHCLRLFSDPHPAGHQECTPRQIRADNRGS